MKAKLGGVLLGEAPFAVAAAGFPVGDVLLGDVDTEFVEGLDNPVLRDVKRDHAIDDIADLFWEACDLAVAARGMREWVGEWMVGWLNGKTCLRYWCFRRGGTGNQGGVGRVWGIQEGLEGSRGRRRFGADRWKRFGVRGGRRRTALKRAVCEVWFRGCGCRFHKADWFVLVCNGW